MLEAEKTNSLANDAERKSNQTLRTIIQRTVFSEFERKSLKKNYTNQIICDGGSILANVFDSRFFSELSLVADKEASKEDKMLESNFQTLQRAQSNLDLLDSQQALHVLNLYSKQGVQAAINYILNQS